MFRGQPRWVILALAAIVVCAVLLYTWNIGYSGLSPYYASAVRSMLRSPRALFFGSLDPSSTITLDKLAGFLVPQVVFAKLFGFSAWSLSLPQAIEGAVTVVASYAIGTRWRGAAVGIAVAGIVAFTPMLAAMFGRPMEDGMLTMCLALAMLCLQRAVMSHSLGWLVWSGVWVGIGFQAKMLQSWLFLPAIVVAYLVGGGGPLARRVSHIALALVVSVLVSVSWMSAIQLVPAHDRPYIDGTTNNNEFSMVFGYNGVDRILPGAVPGAVSQLDLAPGSGQSLPNATATSSAGHSVLKLVLPQFSTQIGWLYPAAAVGIGYEVIAWRKRRRHNSVAAPDEDELDDARLGTSSGLVTALAVQVAVLSVAFVPHATYFAVLALPLAALACGGFVSAIATFRRRLGRRWLVLPGLVVVQALWIALIAETSSPKLAWIAPVALVFGLISIVALLAVRMDRPRPRSGLTAALVTGIAAAMIGPVAWSMCVLGPGGGGSASDAFAGPRLAKPTAASARSAHRGQPLLRRPFSVPTQKLLYRPDRALAEYVSARNRTGAIAFATDTMPVAVAIILATELDPMPMGGFSRQAPEPELSKVQALISAHRLRFVLLSDPEHNDPAPPNPTLDLLRSWVVANCRPAMRGNFRQWDPDVQTLYDCVGDPTTVQKALGT